MKGRLAALLAGLGLVLVEGHVLAGEGGRSGIRTTDKTGCYLTDGSFTGPTIVLTAGLYHEPGFPRDRALQIIDVALAAGCSIEEPDEVGSTPLAAAILYNEPELVRFLLERGADPYLKLSSPKPYLDGRDAFEIVDFLMSKQPSQDRSAIQQVMSRYRQGA